MVREQKPPRQRDARGRFIAAKPDDEEPEEEEYTEAEDKEQKEEIKPIGPTGATSTNMDSNSQAFLEALNQIMAANREAAERDRRAADERFQAMFQRLTTPADPATGVATGIAAGAAIGAATTGTFTLKPSEVHEFKPASRHDDRAARIFIERINDVKAIYPDQLQKIALVLPRCLDNEVAQAWFSALSEADKRLLQDSPANWVTLIQRDFMGTLTQLRLAADKEMFRWNQNRSASEYIDEKVGKLRIAGMASESDIVQRVYDGFYYTPEFQAALEPYLDRPLEEFRNHVRGQEDIQRRLHDLRTPRQTRDPGYSTGYSTRQPQRGQPQDKGPSRPIGAQQGYSKPPYVKPDPDAKPRPPVKRYGTDPPRPCWKCKQPGQKGNHWVVDCPLNKEKKGFTGQEEEEEPSDEERDPKYEKKQNAYVAYQSALAECEDSGDSEHENEEEIEANYGLACRECNEEFPSNNQLHQHLQAFNAHAIKAKESPKVIDLTGEPKGETLEGISDCTETRVRAYRAPNQDSPFSAVIDTGFGRSAVNKAILSSIPHTVSPVKRLIIRGIGGRQAASESATFALYLRDTRGAYLRLRVTALVLDDLGTDLLISTDYIRAWNLIIDVPRQLAVFHRHDGTRRPIATIRVQVTRQASTQLVVRAAADVTVPPRSMGRIPLRLNHSGKADLVFSSQLGEIPDGVISVDQSALTYANERSSPHTVKRGTILGTASSVNGGNFAYSAQATEVLNGLFANRGPRAKEKEKAAGKAEKERLDWLEQPYRPRYSNPLPDGVVVPDVSTSTFREIHVNDKLTLDQRQLLRQLAQRFAVLFNEVPGMARQSEDDWLRIKVAPELERRLKPRPPYRNAPRAREAIDETFDENTRLGRMAPAKHSPYSLPVFVVYKYTPEGTVKKARPVVDLRPLNDVAESDAYPLPLQEDILASLANADWISSVDFVSSFYQHFVHPDDQYRTATVSHRGLELFRVAPMGFKNSPAHNQRTFERLFQGLLWKIVNVYVDDVNIFTKGEFERHLRDLDTVFRRLADAGYTFKASKTYLGYQELVSLGKLVDRLGYSTDEEKLQAIAQWDVPRDGHALERFLGFVGWHRQQVPFFAQRAEPLQRLKTAIFKAPRREKGAPADKPQERKNRGSKALDGLWREEHLAAFEDLKGAFTDTAGVLRHFDPSKALYVFLDASKELGFGVAAYQSDGEPIGDVLKPNRTSLRPIVFLSKCLTPAERNYWPTDLELAGLVWAVKHLRIYIEQTRTVIFTDHRANPIILAAKSLRTTSPLKMNARQQGWAVFLSQYWDNLTVVYKEGRDMVVPDALSRMSIRLHARKENVEEKQAFIGAVLIGFDQSELTRMRQEVREEFNDLFELFEAMPRPVPNPQRLPGRPYALLHQDGEADLVRIENDGQPRFAIPRSFRQAVLQAAHDDQIHGGYTRLRGALEGLWWPKMSRDVLRYVRHCNECNMNKPRRIGTTPPLKPLPVPPRPFYSLTMDFITDLPAEDGHDMTLVVVDRLSKRVAFETGRKAQPAEDWAKCFWDNVICKRGYGLPHTLTTDRDARFTSALWRKVFELAGTRLIYTAAYHPSADGQSERVNQELEIALRFYVDAVQANWKEFLPTIEFYFNGSYSSVVEQTPFQVIYGFTPSTQLTLLAAETPAELIQERIAARDIAIEGLQAAAESMTNRALQDRSFKSGWARLRLSPQSYSLPSTRKFALSPRYTRPFKILEEVGRGNALRLELPTSWKIHPVINKIHLDPATDPADDPYQRQLPPPPDHVDEQGNEQWRVDKIVGKRVSGDSIEYRVRWQGYDEDDDTWESPDALLNAQQAVQAYEEALRSSTLRGRRQADGSTVFGEPRGRRSKQI